MLDVVFREDASRVRNGDEDAQAENVGWLRRMVLSVLKQIKTKSSLNGMRLKAGWDEAYMEEILLKIKGF
ncbi:hypothetical protein [Fimbriiglobus ruber]|uniref:hypothetical protein n=1 Tax=Fimbriiglobus ruber TaxID=1908690 RepID=UPI000B4B958B|nr:hypothetical protein [Fimbriiglobus ruber]